MPNIGRLRWVGIAIESSPGVPKTPANYLPFADCSLIEVVEKVGDTQARGIVDAESENSQILKTSGKGTIKMTLDPTYAPYLLKLALGTSTPTSLGSGVYSHAMSRNNSNTPTTASITHDRVVDRRLATYAVVNSLSLSFKDNLAEISADFMTRLPVTTASGTLTTVSGTLFAFNDATVQLGANLTAAAGAVATKVSSFDLKVERNAELVYQSGSADPAQIIWKEFKVSGSFSVLFENTTQRDAYLASSKQAVIVKFNGNGIGGGFSELIQIRVAKLRSEGYSIDSGLDNLILETVNFVGEYSSGDSETMDATVQNRLSDFT